MSHARPSSQPSLEEAVQKAILGQAPLSGLQASIAQERAALAHLQADIDATARRLEAATLVAVRPYLQVVHASLGRYRSVLGLLEKHADSGRLEALKRALQVLRQNQETLDRVVLDLRNAALAAVGPTDIPDLNLLHRLLLRVRSGEADTRKALDDTIGRFYSRTQAAARELEHEGGNCVEATQLKDAYQRHLDALATLRQFAGEERNDLLEATLERLLETFSDIRRLLPALGLSLLTQGPTPSAVANAVINLARARAEGRSTDDALRDAVERLREHLGMVRARVTAQDEAGPDPALADGAQRTREALQQAEAAVSLLVGFFERPRAEVLVQASDSLAQAIFALHACHLGFQEQAERENKTPCFKCQHYNPAERRTCLRCGAVLAHRADAPRGARALSGSPAADSPAPLYQNLATLLDAVGGLAEGRVPRAEFEATLQWFETLVESQAAHAEQPVAAQGEQVEAVAQAQEHLVEAIQLLRGGLVLFRQSLAAVPRPDLLREGARRVLEANRHIHAIHESTVESAELGLGEAWG